LPKLAEGVSIVTRALATSLVAALLIPSCVPASAEPAPGSSYRAVENPLDDERADA
jgi:hypothetical protein